MGHKDQARLLFHRPVVSSAQRFPRMLLMPQIWLVFPAYLDSTFLVVQPHDSVNFGMRVPVLAFVSSLRYMDYG